MLHNSKHILHLTKPPLKFCFFFLLFFALSPTLLGQDEAKAQEEVQIQEERRSNTIQRFSLEEAKAYALEHSTQMRNDVLEIDRAKAQVKELTATGLPQLSGSLSYQVFVEKPVTLIPGFTFGMPDVDFIEASFVTRNNMTAGVEFSQLVYSQTYLTALEASRAFIGLAEQQVEVAEVQVKDGVTKTYLSTLVAVENINIIKKNIKVLTKIRYGANQLYENGFGEQLDVDRLDLSISNLKTQIASLERQIQMAKNALKLQMGLDIDQQIELTDSLQQYIDEALTINLTDLSNPNRLEVKVLEQQKLLNDLDIERLEVSGYPSLAAFGSFQRQFQGDNLKIFSTKWLPSTVVGLRLDVPIFDGFRTKSQIKQRVINRQQMQIGLEALNRSIDLEIAQAKIEYNNAMDMVDIQVDNVELAKKIYNTVQIKYKEGLGTSFEVTQAENELYTAQGNYVNALYQLVVAKANLDKALGNL